MHTKGKRTITTQRAVAMLVAVAACLALAGCHSSTTATNDGGLANTVQVLTNAIQDLENAPATWGTVLPNTITDLNDGLKDAAQEVVNLFTQITQQAEQLTFCITDYFGKRAVEGLQAVLHTVSPGKHPAPTISPVVCHTDPGTDVTAGVTTKVVYSGFDFASLASNGTHFGVSVYYGNTTEITNVGSVSVTSNYQVVVGLAANTLSGVDVSRNPRLVLNWGGSTVTADAGSSSSLPIVAAPKPPTADYTFTVNAEVPGGLGLNCDWIRPAGSHSNFWDQPLPAGWVIDISRGDPASPGVSLTNDSLNPTARAHLTNYNVINNGNADVHVQANVCGAAFWGYGAIFNRTYVIHMIKRGS